MNKKFNKDDRNKFFYYLFKKNNLNKNEKFAFNSKDANKINVLKLKPISFASIKNLTLRQYQGWCTGRVQNRKRGFSRKPERGGLSCSSVFGPQKKICNCGKSRINDAFRPQQPIRRCIIHLCKFCISQTIYINLKNEFKLPSDNKLNRSLQNGYAILQFRKYLKNKKAIANITCKCKQTSIFLKPFFSINCVCVRCKTPTDRPYFPSDIFLSKPIKNKQRAIWIVSHKYRPGYCECGNINTEIPWEKSVLCGSCGSAVGIRRHLSLRFLSLTRRLPHFWYERSVGNPLRLLIGFTTKRYCCITDKRDNPFVLRNQNFIQLKKEPLRITRKNYKEFVVRFTFCSYPWYCVYTNQILSEKEKKDLSKIF